MCLITKQKEPFIADKDITVYKMLDENSSDSAYSPYQSYHYKLNELYQTIIEEDEYICCFDNVDQTEIEIDYPHWMFDRVFKEYGLKAFGSGFHSTFKTERLDKYKTTIFECVIPKGSEYYIGFTDLVISNQIIIKRKIS